MHFSQGDGEVSFCGAIEMVRMLQVYVLRYIAAGVEYLTVLCICSAPFLVNPKSGYLDLKCTVIKGGMDILPQVGPSPLNINPIFEIGPLEPRYSEWLVFEGISVDEKGTQHYLGKCLEMCKVQ